MPRAPTARPPRRFMRHGRTREEPGRAGSGFDFVRGTSALLLRHHVLEFLRHLEDGHAPRGNGHGFAGARIARDARLAILDPERTEAADLDVVAIRKRLRHRIQEAVDRLGDVLLGEPRTLGDLVHEIGLGHHILLGDILTGRPRTNGSESLDSGTVTTRHRRCQSPNGQGVTSIPHSRARAGPRADPPRDPPARAADRPRWRPLRPRSATWRAFFRPPPPPPATRARTRRSGSRRAWL